MTTDRIGPSAISERNSSMSSCFHSVGRHMRGDWLKIWIASMPNSTPRPCALTRPPEAETCPPTSIGI